MSAFDPSLHLVTDHRLETERLVEVVEAAVDGGVRIVQLRAKTASAREQIEQARRLDLAIAGRALLLIDDRVDVALAARDAGVRVDGVHLGQSDVPPLTARRLLGAESIVGWTANRPEHLATADAMPAGTIDYLGVGVIRPTLTKADHPTPLGHDGFARLASATTLPCVAIGGIGVDDVAPLRAVGAAGVAVVTAVSGASDPRGAAAALRAAWDDARSEVAA